MTDSVREIFNTLLGGTWTTTAADPDVDLRYYFASPGKREMSATLAAKYRTAGGSCDSGSLVLKIQESATTVDSDFVDISGATFTTLTDTDTTVASRGAETIYFSVSTGVKYLRSYATVASAGTTYFDGACILSVLKRFA